VSKRFRIAGLIVLGLLALLAASALLVWHASQKMPQFYREALQADPGAPKRDSDQMLQQATALASDLQQPGRWHAVFTAEQINGWLAVDLLENHADCLPAGFADPRVQIEPGRLRIACRYRQGRFAVVLSLAVEPYMIQPGVIALRIRQARAGALPLPMGRLLTGISEAARHARATIQWRQAEGDPVAVISFPRPPAGRKQFRVESLRLIPGKLSVAGKTERL